MHEAFPDFLHQTYKDWGCNAVVCCGDLVDHAAMSYHAKETDLPNISQEIELAKGQLKPLFKMFPKADMMIGNHDALPLRKAQDAGIPPEMLKDLNTVYGFPRRWQVHERYTDISIDSVIYRHGDKGKAGQYNAAYRNALDEFRSVVQGHHHTQFGVLAYVNNNHRIFGAQVGTGVKPGSPYMRYNRKYSARPVLGCFVIFGGVEALPVPMQLEDW